MKIELIGKFPKSLLNKLSKREQEVLHWLSNGYEYSQIATQLQISINGVRAHIKSIYRKLQVNNNVQAAKVFWDCQFHQALHSKKETSKVSLSD